MISKNTNQKKIGRMKNTIQIGEMIMKKLANEENSKEENEFREGVTNDNLPNYYDVLGVETNATAEEIKKNFRELAKKNTSR